MRRGAVHAELSAAGDRQDALAVSDALEALIAAGQDTPADRQYAYDIVHAHEEDTAPSLFARAAVTGRLVQQKGLLAADLVPEIERCARRSRDLDRVCVPILPTKADPPLVVDSDAVLPLPTSAQLLQTGSTQV
jgi:hypothetical protein